jgi:hypothetical protein
MRLTEEILAESNDAALTAEERSFVRLVLGVGEDSTVALYTTSQTRFDAMSANTFFNKALRVLIRKYGKLGDDVIALTSPKIYASSDQRLRIALMMNNLVFPPSKQVPLEDVLSEVAERELAGSPIKNIPVQYGELPGQWLDDEFGV